MCLFLLFCMIEFEELKNWILLGKENKRDFCIKFNI